MSEVPINQCSGVNDIYEYNELHLDSAARDQGDNNQPIFMLQPALSSIMGVKLVSAQIPFTFYVFNEKNNTFSYYPTGDTNANPVTITIPIGNYTSQTFDTTLETALAAAAPGSPITVDYSGNSGRYTLTSNSGTPFAFRFGADDDAGENNPRLWIGFGPGLVRSNNQGEGRGIPPGTPFWPHP